MGVGYIDNNRLREIRDNVDWYKMINALGLEIEQKQMKQNELFVKCPWTGEKSGSLHINLANSEWYSFSGENIGGGPIEFMQEYTERMIGERIHCYEAGKRLVEKGISYVSSAGPITKPVSERKRGFESQMSIFDKSRPGKNSVPVPTAQRSEKKKNEAITFNLVPMLTTHSEFIKRGISEATCKLLGCGFLDMDSGYLAQRLVFQVRGVRQGKPVILSHIGRATSEEQKEKGGKWKLYSGFSKTLELYNFDRVMLFDEAIKQAQETGYIVITEGCFDVAKLVEAGILNCVASFGACLSDEQIERLKQVSEATGVRKFVVWYDRDKTGSHGQKKALKSLREAGFIAVGFDWDMRFESSERGSVAIPDCVKDVCDLSVRQIQWIKGEGLI